MFRTSELGLIAALHSLGFPQQEIVRLSDKKVEFKYQELPEIKMIVDAYYANTLTVYANTYYSSLKTVKSQIYALR